VAQISLPAPRCWGKAALTWNRRYAFASYLRSTIWVVPVIAIILEQTTFRIVLALDPRLAGIPGFTYSEDGTVAAMDWVIASSITYMTFSFGTLLVAIQITGGQLTPRIVATTLLRNNVIRFTIGLFVYTLLLAVSVKLRTERVSPLLVSVASVLGLVSTAAFLFLIDYAARLLRPISILSRVSERGLKVLEDVYPQSLKHARPSTVASLVRGVPARTVLQEGTSAIVLAVNQPALIEAARRAGGIIEFAPGVGDFVAVGEPLFRLHGGADAVSDRVLRGQVAFGPERTIEHDPTFPFRVVVDIAIKALSPAINDPTTAVLAIDQLHRLLRTAGRRHLTDEQVCDAEGRVRLIFRTPNWDDFVQLAFSEIRQCGAANFQVARRLRAMIENLVDTLPEVRRAALLRELVLLDRTLEQRHPLPEDLALARVPDPQGLGGVARLEDARQRAAAE
jgi:uncharacterized membrane protein